MPGCPFPTLMAMHGTKDLHWLNEVSLLQPGFRWKRVMQSLTKLRNTGTSDSAHASAAVAAARLKDPLGRKVNSLDHHLRMEPCEE